MLLVLVSCDDKLDLVPKGQVTLQKVSELELLLNQEYSINQPPAEDLGIVCGETVGMFDQISSVLAQTNTTKYALLACDESVDRAVLTTQDARYNDIYRYINFMNVVIDKMPDAEGNESVKPRLVAEAKVMRAYFHWLAVVIYAKQYDEATAAKEGGIAYSTSTDIMEQKQKLTLEESYRAILNDLDDENIALLPDSHGDNVTRGDKAWGNAVKAVVLCQMKRYADALPYALRAIELRPQMFDRSVIKNTNSWVQTTNENNNLLYMNMGIRGCPTMALISPYTVSLFEANDYVLLYDTKGGWSASDGENYSGLKGVKAYSGWSTMCNIWGLTSEQLHYLAAECLIRTGKTDEGLALVDQVRAMRVESPTPFAGTTSSEEEAMALLQKAKWVECIATPFNFFDMKRWNTEAKYKRTITHDFGALGKYTVSPESPLWVMPFPSNAVRYNSSLTQNYK